MEKKGSLERGCPRIDMERSQVSSTLTGCFSKLEVYDWLKGFPSVDTDMDLFEVRFKNSRKGFYQNTNRLRLNVGDIVAVEASPGHDIGVISLGGPLVIEQMKKYGVDFEKEEIKKIYRKAKSVDIDKWIEAVGLEHETMLKSRKIAVDLKLDMKIGDVEYQGDRTKAIFYYIADERVDFRELIKRLADEFRIRIEMRQIGARQEAGRIGGIGTCGRELCCSTWLTNFVSVTTSAARYQEVSINPQKLAGQCGKLKCCLNYEVHCYIDAQKDFPKSTIPLQVKKGTAYHQKTDIFKRIMWYSWEPESTLNLIEVPVERVHEIIKLNEKGTIPDDLVEVKKDAALVTDEIKMTLDSNITSGFDKPKKRKNKRKKKRRPNINPQ